MRTKNWVRFTRWNAIFCNESLIDPWVFSRKTAQRIFIDALFNMHSQHKRLPCSFKKIFKNSNCSIVPISFHFSFSCKIYPSLFFIFNPFPHVLHTGPKRPEQFIVRDCGSSNSSSKRISGLYLHHVKKLTCFVSTKWEEKAVVSWRKLVWGFSSYWYVSVFFYLYLHSPSVQDFSWNNIWLPNRPLHNKYLMFL